MPLTDSRLLIRADAGPTVGTGHVMRMIALAQAYRYRGGQITFVVGDIPQSLKKRIESERFQLFQIRNDRLDQADAIDTREIAALTQPDWIVLDGYGFDDAYQGWFKNCSARLMVMDDYQHAQHRLADLIVNQNVYATANSYPGHESKTLAGVQYALLRDEFLKRSADRRIPSEARRVLVTFGGADPDNWTLRALQVLSDLNRKRLVVDCVVGSCYNHVAELEQFKRTARMTLRIHRNVDRMVPLMNKADLAITGGGSTCYELARCGVPSVVAAIAKNQQPVAAALNELGIMESIDHLTPANGDRAQRLQAIVRRLINDPDQRRKLSVAGTTTVDGLGPRRVVQRMGSFLVPLREAVADDAELLWQWRNHPEVRAVSFSQDAINLADHRRWFTRQLDDANCHIWIAGRRRHEPVGSVRFQIDPATQQAYISVIVDQRHRCRGLGAMLLTAAVDRLFSTTPVSEVIAQIRPGNDASVRAFRSAGFEPIEPTVINGQTAYQSVIQRSPYHWQPTDWKKSA